MKRAKETCDIMGYLDQAIIDEDLREWNYGKYEGIKTVDIRKEKPDWLLFRDGAPQGESPDEVGKRADRMIEKLKAVDGDVAIFSSGHFTRVLGTRWIGLPVLEGRRLYLSTASICILGYEREVQVIKLWNEISHLP